MSASNSSRAGSKSSRREKGKDGSFPMSAAALLQNHKPALTKYEVGEVLDYPTVYYAGQKTKKVRPNATGASNYGYDDERGDYRLVLGDHVRYQYEVVEMLGKGSFGQVAKAYDHKNKEYVALKVIRNKSRFHQQAAIEVKVLKFLKERDIDGRYNVIHIRDYFQFRKHI
jgi:dual specificity tyrosine-phosphorylation-regulated kinase 2/3/4